MNVPHVDPTTVDWPWPWAALPDGLNTLPDGRTLFPSRIYPADSVLGELRREICERHPLYGIECVPIAFDSRYIKEYLFATARPDMPIVLVHFTGKAEDDPRWPFVVPYPSLEAFLGSDRCLSRGVRPEGPT